MDGREVVYADGHYMVRDVFNAWDAAGRPPINSSWRSYADQKYLRDGYEQGRPGFSPADDPDHPESYPLGHMRAAALDIDATPSRVRKLSDAGLIRPFPWESWHWAPRDIYHYPPVHEIPAEVANMDARDFPAPPPIEEGEDAMRFLYTMDNEGSRWTLVNVGTGELVDTRDQSIANTWAEAWGNAKACSLQAYLNALHAVQLTTDPNEEFQTKLAAQVSEIRAQLDALALEHEDAPPKA